MIENIRGRRVIVTGAASGIGFSVARRFAEAGAVVALNHLPGDERGPAAVDELCAAGLRVVGAPADVTDELALDAAVRAFTEAEGAPEIAVANAGIAEHVNFLDQTAEDFDRTVRVHLYGARNLIASTLPRMVEAGFGRVILTVSELALVGAETMSHYCAAKGGMIAMAKSVAREVGPRNVTVNCIAPGPVETELLTSVKEEYTDENRLSLPLQRWGDPDELAWTYLMLAGEAGNWYTGQVLSPNGGAVI